MGCEGPEDVFFSAYFAQVQPVRIDIIYATQVSCVGKLLEPDKDRVILKHMTNHKYKIVCFCKGCEVFSLLLIEYKRFFNKDMLSGQKDFPCNGIMCLCRRGDNDPFDVVSG